ncbi:hypothetical protein [Paludibacterium purpuratum]|uniref:Chain length determinant protein EpsF n=1 Tax=Paludibacterium purpuratum TaxID=1144873 RepID=A0A4R7B2R6_9NEIS|nr:hypothetical protein [Paludibacterium purpuratum]TDR77821.1 chain length determinant protein EpsF [Paludibacterium purpuratum]
MSVEWLLRTMSARRRIAVWVFTAVLVLTMALVLVLPKQWTARSVLAVDEKASDPLTGSPVAAYLIPGYLQTQSEIAASQRTALKVIDTLGLDKRPQAIADFSRDTEGRGSLRDWLAEQLLKKLDVQPGRESSLLTISYTAADPAAAAELANGFASAYMAVLTDMQTSAAQQQNLVFQQQLLPLQESLERAQLRLAAFQRQSGILTDLDQHLDLDERRLNELSTQLATAQVETFDAHARAGGSQLAPDVQNNPLIQQQKALLAQSEVKLRSLSESLGPNHPQYRQAQAERDANRQQLARMTQQSVASLQQATQNAAARQNGLQGAIAHEKSRVLAQKEQATKLNVLQKEAEGAQRAYSQVLQRFSDTSLASHVSQTNLYLLKSATVPIRPSWPRPLPSLAAALLVGGLLAIGCALLVEMRDRRVRGAADLAKLPGLSVLSVIDYTPPPIDGRRASLASWLKSITSARA